MTPDCNHHLMENYAVLFKKRIILAFFKMKEFSSSFMNWTKSLMHELRSVIVSDKHRKHFIAMAGVAGGCASDLGSIPAGLLIF